MCDGGVARSRRASIRQDERDAEREVDAPHERDQGQRASLREQDQGRHAEACFSTDGHGHERPVAGRILGDDEERELPGHDHAEEAVEVLRGA